jgi:hypothetical protein
MATNLTPPVRSEWQPYAWVVEKEMKKVAEVEAKAVYKVEEEAQLEKWKQEELDKIARKAVAIDKLKVDRQVQLTEKDHRRAAQAVGLCTLNSFDP